MSMQPNFPDPGMGDPEVQDSMQPSAARVALAKVLERLGLGGSRKGTVTPMGPGISRSSVPTGGVGAIKDREPESWQGSEQEKKLLVYLNKCFRMAADARRQQEGRYITNYAYYRDRQYEYWDDQSGTLQHWRSRDPNPYRSWDVHNKIKPKLRSLISRTFASNLEVLVTAMSESPGDKAYSAAQRAVQDHVASENKMEQQNLELIRGFTVVGPQFRKTWVDWDGEVLRPLMGEDAQSLGGVEEERSGSIKKGIFGWEEAYPDPRGDSPAGWQWFFHAQQLPLDEVIERFPERGMLVKAGGGQVNSDDPKRRMDFINRNTNRDAAGYDTVLVKEFWHKPSATWPEGLTAWEADGVLLWSGPWLYPGLKELPFVMYCYEKAYNSPWADAATDSVRGAQDHYNEAMNAIVDATKEGPKLLLPTGAGIKTDAFRRGKPREVIPYDSMTVSPGQIQYLNYPAVPDSVNELLQIAEKDIGDILGVDPISEGRVPMGIEAAAAIQSLEEFNKASSVITIETYRQSLLLDAQITEQLSRIVYSGQALLMSRESSGETQNVDSGADIGVMQELLSAVGASSSEYAEALTSLPSEKEADGLGRVIDLDALHGGRAVVDIRASTPKTAPQRQKELLEMARTGMFAPENLDVTIPLLEALQVQDFDKLRAQLLRVLISRQAKSAQEMEQAQQMQSGAEGQAQASGEQAMQMKQMEIEARSAESDARNATEIEKARITSATQIQIALIGAESRAAQAGVPSVNAVVDPRTGVAMPPSEQDWPDGGEQYGDEYDYDDGIGGEESSVVPPPLTEESFAAAEEMLRSVGELEDDEDEVQMPPMSPMGQEQMMPDSGMEQMGMEMDPSMMPPEEQF